MTKWTSPKLKELYDEVTETKPKTLQELLHNCYSDSNITVKNKDGAYNTSFIFDMELFESSLYIFYGSNEKIIEEVYNTVNDIVNHLLKDILYEMTEKLQYTSYSEPETLEVLKTIQKDCIQKYIIKDGFISFPEYLHAKIQEKELLPIQINVSVED